MLLEDNDDVRAGMAQALRTVAGVEVLEGASLRDGLAIVEGSSIDVALIDLGLPDGSGQTLIRRVREQRPAATVIVITMFGDDESILTALRAGAHGYLLKDASPEEIVTHVQGALQGGPVLSPPVARRVVASFFTEVEAPPLKVGRRELELLQHLHEGCSYKEAAVRMEVELGTIQSYVKRIYRKLGATSKVEALRSAVRRGILRP